MGKTLFLLASQTDTGWWTLLTTVNWLRGCSCFSTCVSKPASWLMICSFSPIHFTLGISMIKKNYRLSVRTQSKWLPWRCYGNMLVLCTIWTWPTLWGSTYQPNITPAAYTVTCSFDCVTGVYHHGIRSAVMLHSFPNHIWKMQTLFLKLLGNLLFTQNKTIDEERKVYSLSSHPT